jgi:F-type H+-transporting ATPase subunit delta
MNAALASHYACALADAVLSFDSDLEAPQAVKQLRSAESVLSSSQELQLILLSPAVGRDRKLALVHQLAGELGLHRTICNFILLVVVHRRTGELKRIILHFEEIVDERLGLLPAEICSGRELGPEEREKIEHALKNRLGRDIKARYKVDSSLLGGVKAFVDSKEYDATIRGRLERLRTQLLANV